MSSESSAPPATAAAGVEATARPADVDATQGQHFRRLLGQRATILLTGSAGLAALVIGAAAGGILIGLAALAAVLVAAAAIVFALANRRAAEDFYAAYAAGRGLRWTKGKSRLPQATPLLRRGDRRYCVQRFDGALPGGIEGALALYTYEEETRDSKGNRQTTYHRFTVVIAELPATAPFIRELFCQRRVGFRFLDGAEDLFRRRQRVEHESEAVDKRYEIFIGRDDDLTRARQILSPSFLVWLDRNSPERFAFELVAGALVTNVKGHLDSAAELDELCAASAAVARRLLEEATEAANATEATEAGEARESTG